MKKTISLLITAILLFCLCPSSFSETQVYGATKSYCPTCKKSIWPMQGIQNETYEMLSESQHYHTTYFYYYCHDCRTRVDRSDFVKAKENHVFQNNICIYCGYSKTASSASTKKPTSSGRTNTPISFGIDWDAIETFPRTKILNRTSLCNKYGGTEIEEFASVCSDGCALRNDMVVKDRTRIGTLHAFEIVYVYFSVFDSDGREWYYVVSNSGLEGFASQTRVALCGIGLDD